MAVLFEVGAGYILTGQKRIGSAWRVLLGSGAFIFTSAGMPGLLSGADPGSGILALLMGAGFGRAAYTGRDHVDPEASLRLDPCPCCLHATLWPGREPQSCRLCEWEVSLDTVDGEAALNEGQTNFKRFGTCFHPDRYEEWGGAAPSGDEDHAKLELIDTLLSLYGAGPFEVEVPMDTLGSIDRRLTDLANGAGSGAV